MFRASQTARKCFHLFRSLEELEKIQALMHDTVRPSLRMPVPVSMYCACEMLSMPPIVD